MFSKHNKIGQYILRIQTYVVKNYNKEQGGKKDIKCIYYTISIFNKNVNYRNKTTYVQQIPKKIHITNLTEENLIKPVIM